MPHKIMRIKKMVTKLKSARPSTENKIVINFAVFSLVIAQV